LIITELLQCERRLQV